MMNRAVLRRAPALAAVLVAMVPAAVVATVTIAAAMQRSGDVMMVASDALAMADSLPLPHPTTVVPILEDGPLPVPAV